MTQYIVKFSSGSAPGRAKEIFDSFHEAQSFLTSQGQRNGAESAVIYQVDKDGNEIGDPHTVKF